MIDKKKTEEAAGAFVAHRRFLDTMTKNDLVCGFKQGEDWVQVIENTHYKDGVGYDNLNVELGKIFKSWIDDTMNQEIANTVKVKIEITKVEDK